MLAAVLSGFGLSLAAPLLHRMTCKAGWLLCLFPAALTVYFSLFMGELRSGEIFIYSYAWAPSLGVNLSFYLDGLSLLFALLISGVGALIVLYSSAYLAEHKNLGRLYAYLLMFMSSMLGTVLSGNIITLFVFWELTGLSSFLLIGFEHEREGARKAAWQALLVTTAGGLALLLGLLLLGEAGGSFEISALLGRGTLIRSHPLYVPMLLLILVGAFTKSAQFPFHFWLPNAMEAPTPVSAYLHSATMVKAGVYLLARLSPILGGTAVWQTTIVIVGATTMLLGAFLALRQTDLKRILAYSTLSILGALMFLLGIGTRAAVEAAMAYLIIHALYKAGLFLVAGIIDHEAGTRDVNRLKGLGRLMPITFAAAGLAAFSMAGLPPFFGFIGKELLYAATLEAPLGPFVLTGAVLLTNVLLVAVAGIVGLRPFIGSREAPSKDIHEASFRMWIGPLVLSGLGLLIGLVPQLAAGTVVSPAVAAVLSQPTVTELVLLHGLTVQLALSGLTFALGVAVYVKRDAIRRLIGRIDFGHRCGPEWGYNRVMDGTVALARLQTRILQSGHLHYYLFIIIGTMVCLVGWSMSDWRAQGIFQNWSDIRIHECIVASVILMATAAIVRARSRMFAVAALGVIGYSVALIFVMFGAPDLAMTQFSIDTLTVILLVLVIYRMPKYVKFSRISERVRDATVALAAGILVTFLTLAATAGPTASRLSSFFAENSYPAAKGRNIVNVILVDFRALDTLGEITVLAAAAIGVYSLVRLRMDKNDDG